VHSIDRPPLVGKASPFAVREGGPLPPLPPPTQRRVRRPSALTEGHIQLTPGVMADVENGSLSHAGLCVFLALRHHCYEEADACWPSHRGIARFLGWREGGHDRRRGDRSVGPDTVKDCIRTLCLLGHVSRGRDPERPSRWRYTLAIAKGVPPFEMIPRLVLKALRERLITPFDVCHYAALLALRFRRGDLPPSGRIDVSLARSRDVRELVCRSSARTISDSRRRLEAAGLIALVRVAKPDPDAVENRTGWRTLLPIQIEAENPRKVGESTAGHSASEGESTAGHSRDTAPSPAVESPWQPNPPELDPPSSIRGELDAETFNVVVPPPPDGPSEAAPLPAAELARLARERDALVSARFGAIPDPEKARRLAAAGEASPPAMARTSWPRMLALATFRAELEADPRERLAPIPGPTSEPRTETDRAAPTADGGGEVDAGRSESPPPPRPMRVDAKLRGEVLALAGRLEADKSEDAAAELARKMTRVFKDRDAELSVRSYMGRARMVQDGRIPMDCLMDCLEAALGDVPKHRGQVFTAVWDKKAAPHHRRRAAALATPPEDIP
jgi:hypothetical protein